MLNHFFNSLHNIFWYYPIIMLFLSIILFLAIIVILFLNFALFLDLLYRPNIPQYPFNIILDRILPIIVIINPTLLIFNLNPVNISFTEKFLYIILIHIFFLVPCMRFWAFHRNWFTEKKSYITIDQPRLYYEITVALIYPMIWGLYFSLIRFLRLGSEINLLVVFESKNINYDYIIISIFLVPYLILWILMFLLKIMHWRIFLWEITSNLVKLLHLYLLRFNIYFYLIKQLHRLAFIVFTFISLTSFIYKKRKKTSYRYILQYFYQKPKHLIFISLIFLFFLVILETLFCKGSLYYSLYCLFLFPILTTFFHIFYQIYTMTLLIDVCNADYFSKNWDNPRYPRQFWAFLPDNSNRYNFDWTFSTKEILSLELKAARYVGKKETPFSLHQKVYNRNYCIRLKATYKCIVGVRWLHTERTLIHSFTSYITRGWFERLSIINQNWRDYYSIVLRAEKQFPTINIPSYIYQHDFGPVPNNMQRVFEQNLRSNFVPLIEKGVKIEEYLGQKVDIKVQSSPDVVFDLSSQNNYPEKRVHTLDQKSGKSVFGNSKIFSNMEIAVYKTKLNQLKAQIYYSHVNLNYEEITNINNALNLLFKTCDNLKEHQLVWAQNVHFFPDKYIPPLRIKEHFSIQDLRPEVYIQLKKAELLVEKVSNYLYAKKITEIKYNEALSPDHLGIFYDSEIQTILREL